MSYTKKDLVTAANLTKDEIYHFLNLAKEFKALNNSETKKAKFQYNRKFKSKKEKQCHLSHFTPSSAS